MAVVDIRATTTLAPPADFVRWGRLSNGTYLWLRRESKGAGLDPVTDLIVLYDDERVPSDYVKIPDDLSGGVFFAVARRAADVKNPIVDVRYSVSGLYAEPV